ncbi:MAG TPA: UDP-N-acetylmuramoyl-L-alanine--D-glutamate ligase [Candidatus Saccharimonadales bacterium]|nr:UDP-N-acetylmuramoyl-L-alanine--D-glutamate ligase [Candidatus Saccharimonadales bacterium]
MKIAILGFGLQGQSAYTYWHDGNEITICDRKEDLEVPEDAHTQLGPSHLEGLSNFDLIVRSPLVHPDDIVAANSPEILAKVTTVTNEFFRVCPTKNIIGVTGTKGKGTTSSLIAKLLGTTGKRVHLGGNIGVAPLDMLKENIGPDDWVVLELANFQLIDIEHSPHIGVCLMIAAEHLDWHANEEDYFVAKSQMFMHQTPEDIAIYYAKDEISSRIAHAGSGKKIPYFEEPGALIQNNAVFIGGQRICGVEELKLLGKHNWQNVCAAVTAVWQITQDVEKIRSVLTSFGGLEHRLEPVRVIDGAEYYNDSFGTTPSTAIVAIEAFKEPKVIILGGSDKGSDYNELAKVVAASNMRAVILIGEQAGRIRQALEAAGVHNAVPGGKSIEEIVATARKLAQPGDVVLFSPACASFDMFKNYKDRGEKFKQAVLAAA